MGYSAFVPCNCYQEGKITSRPPYEEFVVMGNEGLELNLPWEGNQLKHNELWRWKNMNPCQHKNMRFCDEGLANSSGMGSFRFICQKLGSENYPILNAYLPTSNDGYLPSRHAQQLLDELEKMCNLELEDTIIKLTEVNTNKLVYSTSQDHERRFVFGGKSPYDGCLGNAGFYVTKKYQLFGYKFKRIVWSSTAFTQEKDKNGKFYFRDKKSGNRLNIDFNLIPQETKNNDFFEFQITKQKMTIMDEYYYIIPNLVNLAKASIETGNNICWL